MQRINAELINIPIGGGLSCGCNQEWYASFWQRQAGCGPATAANIFLYLNAAESGGEAGGITKARALEEMEVMWRHFTPGRYGLNSAALFEKGVKSYSVESGQKYISSSLIIPCLKERGNVEKEVSDFILTALTQNTPPAFLNLSRGGLKNISGWHWVTITAFDAETFNAEIYDEGKFKTINLRVWLNTARLGGAFVRVLPE